MRTVSLIILFSINALAFCQGFNKRYDDLGHGFQQTAFGIERTTNGWTIISGSDDRDSIGPGLWFYHASTVLRHIDAQGHTEWEKRAWRAHHSVLPGWANCSDTIPGGGYVVGGASEDTTGLNDVYLMRFDADGDTLWTRVFGDPNGIQYWIGRQVKRAHNGDFLIVGDRGGAFGANVDAFIIRTDSLGNELWRRAYGGAFIDGFVSIHQCSTNSFYAGGVRFNSTTDSDLWVQRIDDLGDVLWSVSWGGIHKESNAQLSTLSDGHAFIAGGWSHAADFAAMRPYLAKLDSTDGSILWEYEYGPEAPYTLFFVGKECPGGDLIAAGVTFDESGMGSGQKGLLCRITSTGDSLWMFAYYYQDDLISTGQGRFYDVLPTPGGGFIAAGATYNPAGMGYPPGYSQDTWVVKVDSMGCIIPGCNSVGIAEQATNLLDALTIFPNPARDIANLRLELPPSVAHLPLQLSVVGVDGRIAQQRVISGNGDHTLALHGLAAGVYYVHIASEGKWLTGGKLIIQ